MTRLHFTILFISLYASTLLSAQSTSFLFGDALPDAPELAARGQYKVGVQTLQLVHKGQIDVLKSQNGNDPLYDRPLTVEVWYPAQLADGTLELVAYDQLMGTANDSLRPLIPFKTLGRSVRTAEPLAEASKYPLIVVSHGYVGSRYLMTYLTENLASKGYVVVAIDHTDSTFGDAGPFQSTLLNRAKDIHFVIDEIESLAAEDSKSFLHNLVDAQNTAIIGYSMGGYGVLNVAGAGYSNQLAAFFVGMTGGSRAIEVLTSGNSNYKGGQDQRIKAVIAFAPWGMERGVWDSDGLLGLKIPAFFVAGSQDDISGYEKGIKAIYDGARNADRYLLTYRNARHNVAPNPPPVESLAPGLPLDEYYRYAEPSWDERRLNNINQHFVTAFLGVHLKNEDFGKYLELEEDSNAKDGWLGFLPRSSTGMELLHSTAD
jgi:predicted dienelactone hydrolase